MAEEKRSERIKAAGCYLTKPSIRSDHAASYFFSSDSSIFTNASSLASTVFSGP